MPEVPRTNAPRILGAALVAVLSVAAACTDSSSAPTTAPPARLPRADGLVLIEPPELTGELTIADTGWTVRLGLLDGCITGEKENGEVITLHFFDGYAGFDGDTLFFRPLGDPGSVPAEFEHGEMIGVTGHDGPRGDSFVMAPPAECPDESGVVYRIRRTSG